MAADDVAAANFNEFEALCQDAFASWPAPRSAPCAVPAASPPVVAALPPWRQAPPKPSTAAYLASAPASMDQASATHEKPCWAGDKRLPWSPSPPPSPESCSVCSERPEDNWQTLDEWHAGSATEATDHASESELDDFGADDDVVVDCRAQPVMPLTMKAPPMMPPPGVFAPMARPPTTPMMRPPPTPMMRPPSSTQAVRPPLGAPLGHTPYGPPAIPRKRKCYNERELADLHAESNAAREAGVRWQDRGPPTLCMQPDEVWRGQRQRGENSNFGQGRVGNRGGGTQFGVSNWWTAWYHVRDCGKPAKIQHFLATHPRPPCKEERDRLRRAAGYPDAGGSGNGKGPGKGPGKGK